MQIHRATAERAQACFAPPRCRASRFVAQAAALEGAMSDVDLQGPVRWAPPPNLVSSPGQEGCMPGSAALSSKAGQARRDRAPRGGCARHGAAIRGAAQRPCNYRGARGAAHLMSTRPPGAGRSGSWTCRCGRPRRRSTQRRSGAGSARRRSATSRRARAGRTQRHFRSVRTFSFIQSDVSSQCLGRLRIMTRR